MRNLKKGQLLTVQDIIHDYNLGQITGDYVFAFEDKGNS